MSTKYQSEKLTIEIVSAILGLIQSGARYTSKEIVSILASDFSPEHTRTYLYRLRDQGDIGGGAYKGYTITRRGASKLKRLRLTPLVQRQNWDAKWRMVIYDIPEEYRKERDLVRRLIKQLGFRQLQQSVWVHPLPCLNEFEVIRNAYGINNHLLLLEVNHSRVFSSLLKSFHLQEIEE